MLRDGFFGALDAELIQPWTDGRDPDLPFNRDLLLLIEEQQEVILASCARWRR